MLFSPFLVLGRIALVISNFPVENLSVCASVCLVHCGKTTDRIRLGIGPREGILLERIWGAPLKPMGTLRRTCATQRGPLPKLLWADLFIENFLFGFVRQTTLATYQLMGFRGLREILHFAISCVVSHHNINT